MVFGVFDLLHRGHIEFFKQAKKYGDYLVVSVARDVNVKKIKGLRPKENEETRAARINKINLVDKVVIGGLKNPWPHIKKERPDVIALGYDQQSYVDIEELRKIARVVRLKPFKQSIYKSSRIRSRDS